MLLSIGMIVKNEEKYLERCLAALKPILDSVDSELIIADTGSTDRTVEIAEKFTDNVYYFEWINDFAAARNSTLQRAKGEWYMFIDADEIIRDCSDLIRFFNSGEYKKYGSATYIVRSYADMSRPDVYSDIRSFRITVKASDVSFSGAIHESLTPTYGPCRYLDVVADHYGYIFYDNRIVTETAKEKSRRNLELLFSELKGYKDVEKENYLIYNQIADSYEIIDEDDKALEYTNKGLEQLSHNNLAITAYYTHKIILLSQSGRHEEAVKTRSEYFNIDRNPFHTTEYASDCIMYIVGAYSDYCIGDYSQAVSSMIGFFNVYKKYVANKLNTEDLLISTFRLTKPLLRTGYEVFLKSCIFEKNYEVAQEYTRAIQISDFLNEYDYMLRHLSFRVEIMEHTNFNRLPELYYKLDEYNRKQLIRVMRWHIFKTDKHEHMLKKLTEIVKGDERLEAVLEIFRGRFVKRDLRSERIVEFISRYGAAENEDIWCIMLSDNYDIAPYVNSGNFDAERCVRGVYYNYSEGSDVSELFANYDINAVSPDGLENTAAAYKWALIYAGQSDIDIQRLFDKYGQIGLRWFNENSGAENIPEEIRAAIMACEISAARAKGDYKRCAEEMRGLAAACSALVPVIKMYQEAVQNEARSPAPAVNPEFAQLAAMVKQNIRAMLAEGNVSGAENTLLELEQLCPNDSEIAAIKNEIVELKK